MEPFKIITIEDPKEEKILRTKSEPVDVEKITTKEFQDFLDRLLLTAEMSEDSIGVESVGIAAPQVGKNIQVFHMYNLGTDDWETLINPDMEITTTLKSKSPEGCLSVPNVEKVVERYYKVKLRYYDRHGEKRQKTFTGENSIVVQHEYDHLQGILFTDRVS